ncbi:MAG: monovalent cation/H(+) antiporter subunit G [Hyphomicrobiaceae bacterium]
MIIADVLDVLSWVLIIAGSFFVVTGAVGLIRMPDVYTRMHAASVIDTMGGGLLILGLILQAGLSLVALKLIFILALFFFTGPVAAHALAQAALHEQIKPDLAHDRRAYATHTSPSQSERTDERSDRDKDSADITSNPKIDE